MPDIPHDKLKNLVQTAVFDVVARAQWRGPTTRPFKMRDELAVAVLRALGVAVTAPS